MASFAEFKLLPSLNTSLKEQKLFTATDIQTKTIPLLMEGKSVVGVSETGSGKTLSFVLPILHHLKNLESGGEPVTSDAQPRAIVMVPTRELGEQVAQVFKKFTHETRLRVRTLLGGTSQDMSRRNIKGAFEILVATPGRAVQMLEQELLDLSDVHTLVFDEVDQMLDQGFLPDAKRIVSACPENRQMVMFSATVSKAMQSLMDKLFEGAEIVKSKNSNKLVSTLKVSNRNVKDGKRMPILLDLLAKKVPGGTMIFTNTREQCDKLAALLKEEGVECLIYRGEMDKTERRTNFKNFRQGKVEVLIATDLASRGLDVDHVGRVINYHLPREMENYMHRVGRTARAGRKGLVVNLVTERDRNLMKKLEQQEKSSRHRP